MPFCAVLQTRRQRAMASFRRTLKYAIKAQRYQSRTFTTTGREIPLLNIQYTIRAAPGIKMRIRHRWGLPVVPFTSGTAPASSSRACRTGEGEKHCLSVHFCCHSAKD